MEIAVFLPVASASSKYTDGLSVHKLLLHPWGWHQVCQVKTNKSRVTPQVGSKKPDLWHLVLARGNKLRSRIQAADDLTGSKNTRGATLQNKTGSNRKTKEQEEAQKDATGTETGHVCHRESELMTGRLPKDYKGPTYIWKQMHEALLPAAQI